MQSNGFVWWDVQGLAVEVEKIGPHQIAHQRLLRLGAPHADEVGERQDQRAHRECPQPLQTGSNI